MTNQFGSQPFAFNKDLGAPVLATEKDFTQTNSQGQSVVPLTQEQKYLFDTQGWVVLPNLLEADELEAMTAFITQLHKEPQSIPAYKRSPLGGPTQELADHPAILGFLNEFVYMPYTDGANGPTLANENCYGYRLEMSAHRYVEAGPNDFGPHNGNGEMRLPGDQHLYRCFPGKANAGLVRVLWELAPVVKDRGGTLFISGSHKAAFRAPESAWDPSSSLWESYECPAGSALIFTEGVTHSAATSWDADHPRISVLMSYNTVGGRWHHWDPDPQLVAEMPAKRQTLFRPIYTDNNFVV
ncbi:MAG: phytanoyl-CoA dioxygenase family protein [Chloroflexota bacterium]